MKIEWSEDFKRKCAELDKALGEDSGCFLETAEDCLEDSAYEDDFDKLEENGCVYFDFEDWTSFYGPVRLRVEEIEICKRDILNWHEYYMYRKTMFLLERV